MEMFQQTFVQTGKTSKTWTVLFSSIVQIVVIVVMFILPMIYFDALPKGTLTSFLVAPPPPPPPRKARKSDSCLRPPLLRVSGGCATLGFGVYNRAVHFGLSREQARKAPVCAPFVSTALAGELVPQAQSAGH
jgi:hypothetical protein